MYINETEKNNVIYSIDKIRLKTFLSYSVFSEIEFRFKTCWKDYIKKQYTSPQQKQFFYNYVIEIGDNQSFWFGFCHNTERRSFSERSVYNFTIEFNPNKIKQNNIIEYLLNLSGEWFLRRFDLAMDLKINILDIITDISGKRKMYTISNGFDDKTYVFGVGDGKIKIYNKKIESKLDIRGDLTRVEVTREFDDFPVKSIKKFDYGSIFPSLYLNQYIYSLSDYEDKTLLALLYAVQSGYQIKDLTRRYREKIRNMLEGGYKIIFDNVSATQSLVQTIFYYFIKNPRIKWD